MKLFWKDCKLWWPAWQQGVPVEYYDKRGSAGGLNYRFNIDSDMDSWLCPDGQLMPISTAKLFNASTNKEIKFTSIANSENHKVQVNLEHEEYKGAYIIEAYSIEDLYFEGETYYEDE